MISDVYLLAKAMLPKGTEEDDPPFPNCTDARYLGCRIY